MTLHPFSGRLIVILFQVCFVLFSSAQVFYVDAVKGSDQNPGLKSKPVASLGAAQQLVRQYKDKHGPSDKAIEVIIRSGLYELSEPLTFISIDGGTSLSPVIWRAEEGNHVVVSGGKSIKSSDFVPVVDPQILAILPETARSKVLYADLRRSAMDDLGRHVQYGHALPVVPAAAELYFNGEPMVLARYPNAGHQKKDDDYIRIGTVLDPGSVPRIGDKSARGALFNYTDLRHERWIKASDVWLQGTFNYGFADDFIKVAAIDTTRKNIQLSTPHLYGVASGKDFQQYVAINLLEELDVAGEYFIDRKAGRLYFWPPAQLQSDSEITLSILEAPVVALQGVAHLKLKGLTVEAGRGIGIYMEGGESNTIENCVVRNVGTCGIFMGKGARALSEDMSVDDYRGYAVSGEIGSLQNHLYNHTAWNREAGKNHSIVGCEVYNTGSGGIYLSGGDKRTLNNGNNLVENCSVHHYNRRNKFTWSGINVDGCGNVVRHCEVYDSDWQGMYVHGNEHLFEYNEIHHVTLNSDDTSPWYIGRDPSDRGNIVRYNYFHDCGNSERMNMGVYCDDSSTGVEVYGNVFSNMKMKYGMLFTNTGWDLVMRNNIVVNPMSHTYVVSAHYYTWAAGGVEATFGSKGLIRKRLTEQVQFNKSPYAERYPDLLTYLDPLPGGKEWVGMRSKGNVFEGNLIVGSKTDPISLLGGEHATVKSSNNWTTDQDPGFVDMEKGNFSLKTNAEVFRKIPGFQSVPFEKMGRYPRR